MFTYDELITFAVKKHGGSICTDLIERAMGCETIEQAAEVLIKQTEYVDSLWWWEE